MADTDTMTLIDCLKDLIKTKGLTYKKLANELGISEISVKRIFSNYDCYTSLPPIQKKPRFQEVKR